MKTQQPNNDLNAWRKKIYQRYVWFKKKLFLDQNISDNNVILSNCSHFAEKVNVIGYQEQDLKVNKLNKFRSSFLTL